MARAKKNQARHCGILADANRGTPYLSLKLASYTLNQQRGYGGSLSAELTFQVDLPSERVANLMCGMNGEQVGVVLWNDLPTFQFQTFEGLVTSISMWESDYGVSFAQLEMMLSCPPLNIQCPTLSDHMKLVSAAENVTYQQYSQAPGGFAYNSMLTKAANDPGYIDVAPGPVGRPRRRVVKR